jgi:hypothetical protein
MRKVKTQAHINMATSKVAFSSYLAQPASDTALDRTEGHPRSCWGRSTRL